MLGLKIILKRFLTLLKLRLNVHRLVKFHLKHLEHNFNIVKKLSKQSKILAYVKQDAYGHGVTTIASALKQADGFGVTDFTTAKTIRSLYTDKVIVHAAISPTIQDIKTAITHDISIVVYNQSIADLIIKHRLRVKIWLKVDTGFNRLGITPELVEKTLEDLMPFANGDIVLMTHFMSSFGNSKLYDKQAKCWKSIVNQLNQPYSYANSAVIMQNAQDLGDWVRPGMMLFSHPHYQMPDCGLLPVMEVLSPIIQIKKIAKGTSIGYEQNYQFEEDTTVAIIGTGYGDGYPFDPGPDAAVYYDGQRLPILGKLTMDFMVVKLGHTKAKIGDHVELWGMNYSAAQLAKSSNTIIYDLFTKFNSARFKKEVIYDQS